MAFRFRKSVKLFPGVRVNFSKGGGSLSVGGPGATVNFSSRGTRTTFGLPGTGLSWSQTHRSPPPRHRRQLTKTEGQFSTISSTAELEAAVADRNTTVVYTGSGRRLSAQQLEAAHRRFATEERRAKAQQEIDAFEEELSDVVNCWRDMPSVPDDEVYEKALQERPFQYQTKAPRPFDEAAHEFMLRDRLKADAQLQVNTPVLIMGAPWLLAAVGVGGALGATSLDVDPSVSIGVGVGGIVFAVIAAVAGSRVMQKRMEEYTERKFAEEWPEVRREAEDAAKKAAESYERARAEAEEAWKAEEAERIAWAQRLVDGDGEAVEEAIVATLGDLDFPFETDAEVGLRKSGGVFIHLDLPEIEDVIPEERYRVLKDGRVKEMKRKAADRNADYADLACGLGLMVAAAAATVSPKVRSVAVAGYTQRKRRGSDAIQDDYVFAATFDRDGLRELDRDCDPVGVLSLAGEVNQLASYVLKQIKPPAWVREFRRRASD
jgi:hypothetical protein